MSNFKIEKNIPVPSKAADEYPFAEMEVGDSFFVPIEVKSTKSVRNATAAYQQRVRNKNGTTTLRFTTVIENIDGKETGVRVWRTQ